MASASRALAAVVRFLSAPGRNRNVALSGAHQPAAIAFIWPAITVFGVALLVLAFRLRARLDRHPQASRVQQAKTGWAIGQRVGCTQSSNQ
jgi:hypothetical protein